MDVFEAIRGRRSIRKYQEKDIPRGVVEKLLEHACWAPSEGNLQPWRFFVVKNKNVKREISRAARQRFVYEAPVVIVVCADFMATSPYGERGINLYCLQSTAAAIQNILLGAHAFGLGACWVGAFDEEWVSDVLKLSDYLRPVALIPLGYPGEERVSRRRGFREVTKWIE